MADFDRWAADLADHISAQQGTPAFACDTCEDEGFHMDMRCYGGPPVEVKVWCLDCGGAMAGEPVDDR